MIRAAYRPLALVWAVCLPACTTLPPLELLCRGGGDEDSDGLRDCEDPDCAASDDCIGVRSTPVKPPPDGGHIRPPLLDAGPAPPDATIGDAASGGDVDAMMMSMPDAQVIPPMDEDGGAEPCPPCATNEACVDGMCQPAAAPGAGAYSLRLLRGVVPAMNEIAFCYDACLIVAGFCQCRPDPYVRIVLIHDGAQQFVGATEVVNETLMPVFPERDFEIELAVGDVLRFDVYDEDDPDRDNLLFSCNADLRSVSAENPRPTELSCVGLGGVGGRFPYSITAELFPRLVP